MTILLIHNNLLVQKTVVAHLRRLGHTVLAVGDEAIVEAAPRALPECEFDAAIVSLPSGRADNGRRLRAAAPTLGGHGGGLLYWPAGTGCAPLTTSRARCYPNVLSVKGSVCVSLSRSLARNASGATTTQSRTRRTIPTASSCASTAAGAGRTRSTRRHADRSGRCAEHRRPLSFAGL